MPGTDREGFILEPDEDEADWIRMMRKKPVEKAKTYVKSPAAAPKGVEVQRGQRGGYYYEDNKPAAGAPARKPRTREEKDRRRKEIGLAPHSQSKKQQTGMVEEGAPAGRGSMTELRNRDVSPASFDPEKLKSIGLDKYKADLESIDRNSQNDSVGNAISFLQGKSQLGKKDYTSLLKQHRLAVEDKAKDDIQALGSLIETVNVKQKESGGKGAAPFNQADESALIMFVGLGAI